MPGFIRNIPTKEFKQRVDELYANFGLAIGEIAIGFDVLFELRGKMFKFRRSLGHGVRV